MALTTCLLVANEGLVESLTIVPGLQCLVRFALLRFDILDFQEYPIYFRNNSLVVLAETGTYVGTDNMREYITFGTDASPYYTQADIIRRRVRFRGYNKKTGQCEFLSLYKLSRTTDPATTVGEISFQAANMAKLFYDLESRYITQIHLFYPLNYLDAFFGYLTNSANTHEYVCSVMKGACATMINATNDCVGNFADIPVLDTNGQMAGNSQACRTLHAAFAATNSHHCPHISFTPMADHDGNIKCQKDGNLTADDLFDQEELQMYEQFARDMGFDPNKGHNIAVPSI